MAQRGRGYIKTTVYDYYNLSYPILIDQRQAFGCNLDKGEFDTGRILKNFYKEYISKNSGDIKCYYIIHKADILQITNNILFIERKQ